MAGGISLPLAGVGQSPIQQMNQFHPYAQDPFTTAIQAYQGVKQGQGQGIQNQLNQAKLPYAGDMAKAELMQAVAQGRLTQEQAQYFGQQAQATMGLQRAQTRELQLGNMLAEETIPAKRIAIEKEMLLNQAMIQKIRDQFGIGQQSQTQQPLVQSLANAPLNQQAPAMIQAQELDPRIIAQSQYPGIFSPKESQINLASTQQRMPESFKYLPASNTSNDQIDLDELIAQSMRPKAHQAAYEAGLVKKAELNEMAWAENNKNTTEDSAAAQQILAASNTANAAYQRLGKYEKGFLFGKLPEISSDAQIVNTFVNDIVMSKMQSIKGNASDKDVERLLKSTVNRELNPNAWNEVMYVTRKLNERILERKEFMAQARARNSSNEEAEARWNDYIKQNSIYDELEQMKKEHAQLNRQRRS